MGGNNGQKCLAGLHGGSEQLPAEFKGYSTIQVSPLANRALRSPSPFRIDRILDLTLHLRFVGRAAEYRESHRLVRGTRGAACGSTLNAIEGSSAWGSWNSRSSSAIEPSIATTSGRMPFKRIALSRFFSKDHRLCPFSRTSMLSSLTSLSVMYFQAPSLKTLQFW